MRRVLAFILTMALAWSLEACTPRNEGTSENPAVVETPQRSTGGQENNLATPETADQGATGNGENILIAYFTMPENVDTSGVDAVAGASIVVRDGEAMGNVAYMASIIHETVGGDLFPIETVEQYPREHDALVDQAAEEQDEDARPALAIQLENLEQYDTVFLGYPNWWGDMPQALYSFLEEYDFSGKTIIPFCPHGGSGFSQTEATIAALQPNATVSENGLAISRNDVAESGDEIAAWASSLGL